MKVLVIGKGGREHALVWKLAQSPRVRQVFCAPGNAGTALDGTNVPLEQHDFAGLVKFAKQEKIGLTVVGPEEPLTQGIVEAFQSESLRIFGPSKEAAQIEGSKVFSKQLMRHADVPTADFRIFDHPERARQYITSREYVLLPEGRQLHGPFTKDQVVVENGRKLFVLGTGRRVPVNLSEPLVVKADGLAAGKGVFVCSTTEAALAAVERIMVKEEFGAGAGRQIVIEKRLHGQELSILALVAGRTILPLEPTQDHKALNDGDLGPNTGGMGAYCPAPLGTPALLRNIEEGTFVPIVHALKRSRRPFRGILYAGIMVTNQGPKVLEFNCRLGDPETQPLLMRLQTDLADLLEATIDDRLDEFEGKLRWDPRPAVCVVLTSPGYPGTYPKGKVIGGLELADQVAGVKVFHAGTRLERHLAVTDGGRVLGVTALGKTLADAKSTAYTAVEKITFPGAHYRRDIGDKALGLSQDATPAD